MNMPEYGRIALSAALLGGGLALSAGAVEATSPATFIDNTPVKTADIHLENLVLPSAWGEADEQTLVIQGEEKGASGTNYAWNTEIVFPGTNTVRLSYGDTNFVAKLYVGALSLADWSAATLDNRANRVARNRETLTMPATWGETPAEGTVKVTVTGPFGDSVTDVGSGVATSPWHTVPCLPGTYTVTLDWGSGNPSEVVQYTVASDGDASAAATVSVDNAFDADESNLADVRDIANHTNVFTLAWHADDDPALTLDGSNLVSSVDSWTWDTNGLTYALYTFTNTVNGSNYVARFRVRANDVIALYGDERIDPLVAKDWEGLPETNVLAQMSRKAISDYLKESGPNGIVRWKSYKLGLKPGDEVNLKSKIALTQNADGSATVTVTPQDDSRPDSASEVVHVLASDTVDGTYSPITNVSAVANVYVEEVPAGTKQRFYRQDLNVERPLRK